MIIFPNAKINIGLNVLEKRPDGYHNIETLFYPVNCCDALEIIEAPDKTKFSVHFSGTTIYGDPSSNICVKAYNLISKTYKIPAVSMHLHKNIPVGAGLGGGSADGSCTIKLLDKIFSLNLTVGKMIELAGQLGSDCPFFILNSPCIATQKGDKLELFPLNLKGYYILVVYPHIQINTKEAYQNIKPGKKKKTLKEMLYTSIKEWKNNIINDFEEGMFIKYPELKKIKEELYNIGAMYASMSGSGSSIYGIFDGDPVAGKVKFDDYFLWGGLLHI